MLRFLRREPGFYRNTWMLALPIILQNLITTSLGFVDTFMVGLLGQPELSAVTAANTPIFLVQIIIFGLLSGLSVLVSQYWGKHDTEAINRCMGIALYTGVSLAALIALALFLAPRQVMALVTDNALLIRLGAPYLRIVGISYVFNTASSVYVGVQRSTENPAMGLTVFTISMVLNTFLNYVLIFGKFGAPALGITGAALATLTARVVEFAVTFLYALRDRRVPLAPAALLHPGTAFVGDFLKYSTPVLVNDSLWGLGTTLITAVIGHMAISEEMLAAYAIMGNIEKFSTVACYGISGASAVIVGKRIGQGASKEEVYEVSWCMLLLTVLVGLVVSASLAALLPTVFIPYLYPLFHLEGLSLEIAATMCVVFVFMMPTKAFDITNISGVLRAGGDVRVSAVIDVGSVWLVALPITALSALVFEAPVALVCLGIQAEGLSKVPLGIWRLRSRKWINDVTREGTS
ncbi:MATE family efflux transporter [Oscillibacter sp.]|jgi:putative MATE family efflux protein|uniref:MATE family efflux transporter n=1 Tax=Oscillibacter sp. TaxID=1945593 RepID=UPI002171A979|nr:MATE family efflux transporter [Oscillibacter sp.]MCI9649398.1 MATE family efflux transporter [Oscillibacter sp.]